MIEPSLYWLPRPVDWRATLAALRSETDEQALWDAFQAAARQNLDVIQTQQLDKLAQARFPHGPPGIAGGKPVRLAILSSSTVGYLMPSIRAAGLRRGLWVSTYTNEYGQYLQELNDPDSDLAHFAPTVILLALDTRHLIGRALSDLEPTTELRPYAEVVERLQSLWKLARERFSVPLIQQTLLPVYPSLLGSAEYRASSSPAAEVAEINAALRRKAEDARVDLLAVDTAAAQQGVVKWHDNALWYRAKQEIHPAISPLYGDLLMRIEAARQGRSSKCLVLDLDNTLWGGVIGDDGLEGIILGQGSALGEAFVEIQQYAVAQSRRGVILAVCSKNDEAVARSVFKEHPEMALKESDIAAFVANWSDKPGNLKRVAEILNIGIDSLVFVDDNPFERTIVRRELPQVWVPELPEDPSDYVQCLSDASFFEAITLSKEDFERSGQYQSNQAREALRGSSTDLAGYLKSLSMTIQWRYFDKIGLSRIVQLINKTNQFNLTTIRYTEEDVLRVMTDPCAFGLQLRLLDEFGDNGIIAIVIGKPGGKDEIILDTWLMSCRVLGRQVEEATLNIVIAVAKSLGMKRITGLYRPTPKNGMVRNHYKKLGFRLAFESETENRWEMDIAAYSPFETFIATKEIV